MPILSYWRAAALVAHACPAPRRRSSATVVVGSAGSPSFTLNDLLLAEAHHVDVDDVARLEAADDALQRAHLIDRVAGGGDDDVTDLDAGLLRRAVVLAD